MKRDIRSFQYRDAHFHIHTEWWDDVVTRIVEDRLNLEAFILQNPGFTTALSPLADLDLQGAPESVKRMHRASLSTGLGPMAAVAGTMAQLAAETSRKKGSLETIIENGGDLFLDCESEVILGLYTGTNDRFGPLALRIPADMMPLAVCSSSGRMGHSLSLGDADVVTVFSSDASLADAAATLGGNLVLSEESIESAMEHLMGIEGIAGCLVIRDDKLGAMGNLPEIIRSRDPELKGKVSRDDMSNF